MQEGLVPVQTGAIQLVPPELGTCPPVQAVQVWATPPVPVHIWQLPLIVVQSKEAQTFISGTGVKPPEQATQAAAVPAALGPHCIHIVFELQSGGTHVLDSVGVLICGELHAVQIAIVPAAFPVQVRQLVFPVQTAAIH